jgi:uncharacterized paraquat-inducible protein A
MSQLVSRILLAIFLFPLAAIFYLLIVVFMGQALGYRAEEEPFVVAGVGTWLAVAVYWSLLWRSSVRWNERRISRTIVGAFVAAGVSAIVWWIIMNTLRMGDDTLGLFVAGVIAILLWLVATVFIWRETRVERAGRVSATVKAITCPTCGYNLTGLSESRCPECGTKYTLDELFAGQAGVGVDVE